MARLTVNTLETAPEKAKERAYGNGKKPMALSQIWLACWQIHHKHLKCIKKLAKSTAAPQRRIREAHFVAIVTPAIKHLRSLSQQLMSDVSPT